MLIFWKDMPNFAPQKIVLLGCAEVDEDAIVLNDEEEADKNFFKGFISIPPCKKFSFV